jgi:putative hydrolase of the HAD superfamily
MTLLMIDLDNTLVDRDAAFRGAAAAVLAEHGLPAGDLAWLTALDASGYTPRREVARAMAQRYGSSFPETAVQAFLDHGAAERVTLPEDVRRALGEAVAAGWTCVVVTNGREAQQETKIRRTGLDTLVHGWVVSETVGHEKPAPEIFRIAADTAGTSLEGAWMIGDSPHTDVLGATGVGARSVWVSGGRPWTETAYGPTHVAPDAAAAVRHVVGAPRRSATAAIPSTIPRSVTSPKSSTS